MSSETRFSLSHSDFWNALLPMGESYIRTRNANPLRFQPPMYSFLPAEERGIINETAFLLFTLGIHLSTLPSLLPRDVVDDCSIQAFKYIERMRRRSRSPLESISDAGKIEAIALGDRLAHYFVEKSPGALVVKPFFPGCGWLNDAEGDVLGGRMLFEVKAGERHFKLSDIRQVLCYCALDFSAKVYDIDAITIVNPRFGTYIEDQLESLCQRISGASASVVLGEIVSYISEPFSRYSAR